MKLLSEKISIEQLHEMANSMFGNLVKAVVDVKMKKIVIDAELHSDEEQLLLENGSSQEDLWGINIYPEFSKTDDNFIEFDSMINLRPSQNNRSRSVDDPSIREIIISIVDAWVL